MVDGHALTHLPRNLHRQLAGIPQHEPLQRRGHAPPQPFPIPPPFPPLFAPAAASNVASGSALSAALGSAFVPTLPLPPSVPPASSFRETLNLQELRALYVPAPVSARRGRPSVSYSYFYLLQTLLMIN